MDGTTLQLARAWNIEATCARTIGDVPDIGVAHWIHQESEIPRAYSSNHALAVGRSSADCSRFIGGRHEKVQGSSGNLTFIPAGDYGLWQFRRAVDVVHIYVPPAMLSRASEEGGFAVSPMEDLPFRAIVEDPLAASLSVEIARSIDPDPPSRLYIDQMMRSLALRLVALHQRRMERRPERGGLAPWQVRRVQEFIAAHLGEDIGLSEIAAISGLSQFHFARAFKKTVGVPPYLYQRRRRLEKARTLLADPSLSVIEVGLSVGFDSPQAFARAFRREVGCTPSAYRRSRLP